MVEDRDPSFIQLDNQPRLLGDIGGTHARFGLQAHANSPVTHVMVLACAEHESLQAAVQHYVHATGLSLPPMAALGMANPVTGDQVAMTNHHWRFSISALRQSLGLQRLVVLNDFTALALSLPQLPAAHLRQIGGAQAQPQAPMALLGAGTGLGVSGLLPDGSGAWVPLSGEGGHVSLPVHNTLEFTVLQHLQQRYGHVSAERVLCGQGLVDMCHALQTIIGVPSTKPLATPAQVLQADQDDLLASQSLDLFCGFLGSVAGDLALTLGARGGVYIGGGLVPRLRPGRFESSDFRVRFEAKGRFTSYLQTIPAWVIDSPVSPALQGASQALTRPG